MKIRSLQVRPCETVELSLPTGGVLCPAPEQSNQLVLGAAVQGCDLLSRLRRMLITPGDHKSDDNLDSAKIFESFSGEILATLRNDRSRIELDRAVTDRRRQLKERYQYIEKIVAAYEQAYTTEITNEKMGTRKERLEELKALSSERCFELKNAYAAVGEGVHDYRKVLKQTSAEIDFGTEKRKNYYGLEKFTFPSLEERVSLVRSYLDLDIEILTSELEAFKIDELWNILTLELKSLDYQVQTYRAEFLDSLVVSPFTGVITQVYKTIGETVGPQEPIVRVENWSNIYLLGWIQAKEVINLKREFIIRTADVFENKSQPKELRGEVVSIRGHDSDNDEWEIVIKCPNEEEPKLPINYKFDRESTEILPS